VLDRALDFALQHANAFAGFVDNCVPGLEIRDLQQKHRKPKLLAKQKSSFTLSSVSSGGLPSTAARNALRVSPPTAERKRYGDLSKSGLSHNVLQFFTSKCLGREKVAPLRRTFCSAIVTTLALFAGCFTFSNNLLHHSI
jgi:hypothetical protein